MIIDRNIKDAVISVNVSLRDAIQKINEGARQSVFVVTPEGVLEGMLTDGDIRRWMLTQKEISMDCSVERIINKKLTSVSVNATPETIHSLFSSLIKFIPLIDERGKLVAIARQRDVSFKIENKRITDTSGAFIVAEIGINHNGDIALAKKLVDRAAEAGADCAKFQMRDIDTLYRNKGNADDPSADVGAQYTLDLLSRFQLTPDEYFEVFDYCRDKGLIPLCTPFDEKSVDALEQYGISAYKVASADLTNHTLLERIAKTGKPMICSTGMSTEMEITDSVRLLKQRGAQFALMHCNSTYPAPFKDINLHYLERLRAIGECVIGYSGHERGYAVALAAVSMGANIIEKHFTLDRNMEGNDHRVSLLPDEFAAMVKGIREIEEARGKSAVRDITQGERMNREVLGKSVVAACAISEGTVIEDHMLAIKSPGQGLAPYRKHELIGIKATRSMNEGDIFFASDFRSGNTSKRNFSFKRPVGVPVRFHDVDVMVKNANLDFIEFHFTYKDLLVPLSDVFTKKYERMHFVTHAPDLFEGDHIIDLCALDESYRERSIRELQRTINKTHELKQYFPHSRKPFLIASVGGWTFDRFLTKKERLERYKQFLKSFKALDMKGIELLPQTLPPFPWYFGGQRYCNLFVDHTEIANFCAQTGMRVCLDISHSKLACNYYKWSFTEFVRHVGPHTAHLHIVDARGDDGEGLQIGEGDIDFMSLAEELSKSAPTASFIPEIWQGHKNNGEGFWIALDRLEKWF